MNPQLRCATLCIVALVLLTACVPFKPMPNVGQIPLYPQAQQVQQLVNSRDGKVITFQTVDSPDQVFAYYTPLLVKDGWEDPQVYSKTANETTLALSWYNGGPEYVFRVVVTPASNGSNSVTILIATLLTD